MATTRSSRRRGRDVAALPDDRPITISSAIATLAMLSLAALPILVAIAMVTWQDISDGQLALGLMLLPVAEWIAVGVLSLVAG